MIEFVDGRLPQPVSLRSATRHRGVVSPICRPCAAAESRLLAPDQVGRCRQTAHQTKSSLLPIRQQEALIDRPSTTPDITQLLERLELYGTLCQPYCMTFFPPMSISIFIFISFHFIDRSRYIYIYQFYCFFSPPLVQFFLHWVALKRAGCRGRLLTP